MDLRLGRDIRPRVIYFLQAKVLDDPRRERRNFFGGQLSRGNQDINMADTDCCRDLPPDVSTRELVVTRLNARQIGTLNTRPISKLLLRQTKSLPMAFYERP
jgi:hypothetical protein